MAISISLIYRLCRFFDIEMKLSSLVLCAVMAFIVNGAAISMSPFLNQAHYLQLGLLVIVAAAIVTFFNEKMLRRKNADTTDAKTAADTQQPQLATATIGQMAAARLKAQQSADQKAAAEAAEEAAAQQAEAEKRRKDEEHAAAARAEAEKAAAAAKAAVEAKAKAEAAAQAAREAAEKKAAHRKAAIEAAQKAAAEKAAQAARRAGYMRALEPMKSLDSILDYAYEQQSQAPEAAICAYQQAIARYPEDGYTPFLVIELGNLYKDQASYHEAINTYVKALDMPIIAVNDAMKQEFHKNLRYLSTVQDILSKHHALSTPFPEISGEIMQEIETEFQHRSKQSS